MKRWLAVSAALLLILFGLVLLQFGSPWSLSRVEASHPRYELAGYWDAAGAPSGPLEHPFGIAVAPSGEVYVTDGRARVIRFSSTGAVLGEWGSEGVGAGQFSDPVGVAVGADGAVFVSDYDQDRIQQFTADGRFISAFGRSDGAPGQLNAPAGLAVDSEGAVYVADFYNHRIDEFRRDGSLARIIGHPGRLGGGALHYPTGVAVLPNGGLLVADAYNYRLQWFDPAGKAVRQAGHHLFWLWPRPASSSRGFHVPTSVAVGRDGTIHVADSGNHRIVMLSSTGEFVSEWRLPEANPAVYSPEHVAISPDGKTVYATDFARNQVVVLRVVPQ